MSKVGPALVMLFAFAGLTLILSFPVWFAIGSIFYPHTHPDFWTWATPTIVLTIAASISAVVFGLTYWTKFRQ